MLEKLQTFFQLKHAKHLNPDGVLPNFLSEFVFLLCVLLSGREEQGESTSGKHKEVSRRKPAL